MIFGALEKTKKFLFRARKKSVLLAGCALFYFSLSGGCKKVSKKISDFYEFEKKKKRKKKIGNFHFFPLWSICRMFRLLYV